MVVEECVMHGFRHERHGPHDIHNDYAEPMECAYEGPVSHSLPLLGEAI